ncbi:hypothetical protein [Companilactobacillus jidongensis]|uniref:hypothetical protein n=1 Tax=Companilactobacillus jidongensis TaxID=2486006 RepID=UPI000F78CE89|nr:hypothetical protein [Companilactobacillus jidongensis]
MIDRPDITEKLSKLVEKRLNSQNSYWASEVNFDKNTENERRVDFVGFKPYSFNGVLETTCVELGTFTCYEIKSCMGDFKSGHGLSFYGDENYLVTTQEFADELRNKMMLPKRVNAILCPDKGWSKLYMKFDLRNPEIHRSRSASEMLWDIAQLHK